MPEPVLMELPTEFLPDEKPAPTIDSSGQSRPPTGGNGSLDRCLKYLDTMDPAIAGQDGHGRTLLAACRIVEFDLSEADEWAAMLHFNDTKCTPPWSEKELRHKLADADEKATRGAMLVNDGRRQPQYGTVNRSQTPAHPLEWQDEIGGGGDTSLAHDVSRSDGPDAPPAKTRAVNLASITIPPDWRTTALPHREFVFGTACPMRAVTLLVSMGGGGKSWLILQAAMGLACGRGLVPGWVPTEPAPVLIVSFEDDELEIRRRMQRIAHAFCIKSEEAAMISENLHIVPLSRPDFFRLGPNRDILPGPHLTALASKLAESRYRLAVLDPVAAMLAGCIEENSNEAAQKVIGSLTSVTPPTCALLLAAHVSKTDRDFATSPRGAGAWSDAARQAWGMRPLFENEKRELPDGTEPRGMVVLHATKSNYTATAEPVFLQRRIDPDAAGVLQFFDVEAVKVAREKSDSERLEAALLAVLSEHDVTKAELSGSVSKGSGYANGRMVRDLAIDLAEQKVTVEQFKTLTTKLLAEEVLIQRRGEGGRLRLIPSNQAGKQS